MLPKFLSLIVDDFRVIKRRKVGTVGKRCPSSEFFLVVFVNICTEYVNLPSKIVRIRTLFAKWEICSNTTVALRKFVRVVL